MAGLNGYAYPDRRQAWLDRLRVNLPELHAIESLAPEPDLGYLAPRCGPPSAAPLGNLTQPPVAAQDADAALAALEHARQHAALQIGRDASMERVCQDGELSGVTVS